MNQQDKKIYKKEDYQELVQTIGAFHLYRIGTWKNNAALKEYKSIRNLLKDNFKEDEELKDHVNSLPTPCTFTWLIDIIFWFCFIIGWALNRFVFKIYLGIMVNYRGEFDAIYFFYGSFFVAIYAYLFIRREKKRSNLSYDMREILKIVRRRGEQ